MTNIRAASEADPQEMHGWPDLEAKNDMGSGHICFVIF